MGDPFADLIEKLCISPDKKSSHDEESLDRGSSPSTLKFTAQQSIREELSKLDLDKLCELWGKIKNIPTPEELQIKPTIFAIIFIKLIMKLKTDELSNMDIKVFGSFVSSMISGRPWNDLDLLFDSKRSVRIFHDEFLPVINEILQDRLKSKNIIIEKGAYSNYAVKLQFHIDDIIIKIDLANRLFPSIENCIYPPSSLGTTLCYDLKNVDLEVEFNSLGPNYNSVLEIYHLKSMNKVFKQTTLQSIINSLKRGIDVEIITDLQKLYDLQKRSRTDLKISDQDIIEKIKNYSQFRKEIIDKKVQMGYQFHLGDYIEKKDSRDPSNETKES